MRLGPVGGALAVALLLGACGSGEDDLTGVPLAERGDELYHGSGTCHVCHGTDLEGTTMGPSFLDASFGPEEVPDQAFHDAVDHGVRPTRGTWSRMPALPTVRREEVEAIIAYVRQQQRARGIR